MLAKASSSKTTTKRKKRSKSAAAEVESSILHVGDDLLPQWMNREWTKVLTGPDVGINSDGSGSDSDRCIYYWMQRDLRTVNNWALFLAQHLAQTQNIPLRVLHVLPCPFTNTISDDNSTSNTNANALLPPKVCEMQMTEQHRLFFLDGLKIVQEELKKNLETEEISEQDTLCLAICRAAANGEPK